MGLDSGRHAPELTGRGLKIDVSWALRQKEAQQIGAGKLKIHIPIMLISGMTGLGNRVLHPPTTPVRKESSADCAVVCDNLVSWINWTVNQLG